MPRNDPTRTTLLRRQFVADMRRRFKNLIREIFKLLVTDDAFGVRERIHDFQRLQREWEFRTDPEKLEAFNRWFKNQVDQGILVVEGAGNQPWTSKYVESAYRRGVVRSFTDVRRSAMGESPDFFRGTREEFLRSSFAGPERVSKLRLLYTRTFEELKGVTATMGQQMNRILASGLSAGKGPSVIAREMARAILGLTRTRAEVIARTEIINAHAEGQLDSLESLGVRGVTADVEWSTAGDDRVCIRCQQMNGKVFTIDEARGLIPLHPNCRCAWIPFIEVPGATNAKTRLRASLSRPERP